MIFAIFTKVCFFAIFLPWLSTVPTHLINRQWPKLMHIYYSQGLKWAGTTSQNWIPGPTKLSSWCVPEPQIYDVYAGTLVFGCRNSVPRSWMLRHCRQPITPSLTTYLYYDYRCVFKFICLFLSPSTTTLGIWNSHLLSLFCIDGML